MKITKIAFASIALACFSSLSASAKNDAKTAYIFGFASSFNDSTVYFTDVQKVDSAYFTRKSKFLVSRENYSYQLRDYLEQQGAGKRTCIVMFDFDQKPVHLYPTALQVLGKHIEVIGKMGNGVHLDFRRMLA